MRPTDLADRGHGNRCADTPEQETGDYLPYFDAWDDLRRRAALSKHDYHQGEPDQ